jgi:polar amino acid transport system substrate-binding protein
MKKIYLFCICVVLLVAITILFVNYHHNTDNNSHIHKILRVGGAIDYAPFEYINEESKPIGFNIDLVEAVVSRLDDYNEIEWIDMGFDALIPALSIAKVDIIGTSLAVTEERAQKIDYTDSTYHTGISITIQRNNQEIKTLNDLVGKKIGVKIATTSSIVAHEIENADVIDYSDTAQMYLALSTGKIDAIIENAPVNAYYISHNNFNNLVILDISLINPNTFAFGVAKNNIKLRKKINKALEEIKKDGTYKQIKNKWFGTN